jgi:hypothetical protein
MRFTTAAVAVARKLSEKLGAAKKQSASIHRPGTWGFRVAAFGRDPERPSYTIDGLVRPCHTGSCLFRNARTRLIVRALSSGGSFQG